MVPEWLHIQVELVGGAGIECAQAPGRIFVVGPGHTFLQLAEAIDDAFARWDVAHLHAFELTDGRLVGLPDETPSSGGARWLDDGLAEVVVELAPGDAFAYTFDLADPWHHRCRVLGERIDAPAAYGARPDRPAIVHGWGWIPDQYGRTSAEGLELSG